MREEDRRLGKRKIEEEYFRGTPGRRAHYKIDEKFLRNLLESCEDECTRHRCSVSGLICIQTAVSVRAEG